MQPKQTAPHSRLRKFFCLIVAEIFLSLCCICSISIAALEVLPDGSGTAESPYEISTAQQLFWFAEAVNGTDTTSGISDLCAVLTDDITISDTTWTPIGTNNSPFTGTFDGQGHTITGLSCQTSSSSCVGMFGVIGTNGVVQNLGVEQFDFSGKNYVGGIAGKNNGTIRNCYCTGEISARSYAGGIAGDNTSALENCYHIGTITITSSNAGGIAGTSSVTPRCCYHLGDINPAESSQNIGMLLGKYTGSSDDLLTSCYMSQGSVYEAIGTNEGSIYPPSETAQSLQAFQNGTVAGLLNKYAEAQTGWSSWTVRKNTTVLAIFADTPAESTTVTTIETEITTLAETETESQTSTTSGTTTIAETAASETVTTETTVAQSNVTTSETTSVTTTEESKIPSETEPTTTTTTTCKKSSKTYNNSPESVQKVFATKCTSQRVIDFL